MSVPSDPYQIATVVVRLLCHLKYSCLKIGHKDLAEQTKNAIDMAKNAADDFRDARNQSFTLGERTLSLACGTRSLETAAEMYRDISRQLNEYIGLFDRHGNHCGNA